MKKWLLKIGSGLYRHWPVIVLCLVFFLVPLIVYPYLKNSFDLPKNLVFRTLVLLVVFLSGIVFIFKKKISFDKRRFLLVPAFFMLGIFVIYYFSTLFSDASVYSFYGSYDRQQGFLQWIFYFLLFLITLYSIEKKRFIYLIWSILFSGVFVSLYGILQYFGVDPLFQYFETSALYSQVFSTLANPNFLGQFLAPLIPISFGLLFYYKNKYVKIGLALSSILFLILVLLTFSRASILGLVFSFFVFFVWVIVKKKISIKKIVLIIFAGLVALTGAFLLTKDKFELNEYNLRSINSRYYMWDAAIEIIIDHPILGTGLETYSLYFPQYVDNEFYYYEEGLNFVSDRPHNEVLEIGVNGGLLAIFAYLCLIFWCFYKYFKDENSPVLNGLFLAFFVYFFQNLFTFSRTGHFVLFTLIISGICIYSVKRKKAVTINFSKFISGTFGVLIVISSIFSFYSFVYKPYLAEANFTEYTQTSFPEKLNNAIYYAPYNSYYRYRALLNTETFDWSHIESISNIEGETINALDWEAVVFSEEDFDKANEIFKNIIDLNPDYPIARMDYGKFLFLNGFYHEAIYEFEYFLEVIPEFWKWRFEIDEKTDYEKKQYHVFFLHSPDLSRVFVQLSEAYIKTQQYEKADFYALYGEDAF